MRRVPVSSLMVVALVGLFGIGGVRLGVGAQDATPPQGYRWHAVAEKTVGSVDLVNAPGYRLRMSYMEWAPGSDVAAHLRPMALVTCVASGALGVTVLEGAAIVTRAGLGNLPEITEWVDHDIEVIIEPLDCFAVDNDAGRTVYTARNRSDETTIAWETHFYPIEVPDTVYVDVPGAPIP